MKSLLLDKDKDEMDGLFQSIVFQQYDVVLWQKPSKPTENRQVLFTQLEDVAQELFFAPSSESDFRFESQAEVFFYCQELGLIFKGFLAEGEESKLVMPMPKECKLLSEDDSYDYVEMVRAFKDTFINNIGRDDDKSRPRVSLSKNTSFKYADTHMKGRMQGTENVGPEIVKLKRAGVDVDLSMEDIPYSEREEQKYAGKREAPRARPKGKKRVFLRKSPALDVIEYELFDLSQGGLSFIINSPDEFSKGDVIEISNLDERPIDPALEGKVMSIRPIDQTSDHKVGVMFINEES